MHTKGKMRVITTGNQATSCVIENIGNHYGKVGTIVNIAQCGDGILPEYEKDANAARIALCWNCHDELVEALDELLHIDPSNYEKLIAAEENAREALRKAKGK